MLVLTRKLGQSLVIGDNIEVTILEITNGSVRLGIQAPQKIKVFRKELIEQISQENKGASINVNLVSWDELTKKFSKTIL